MNLFILLHFVCSLNIRCFNLTTLKTEFTGIIITHLSSHSVYLHHLIGSNFRTNSRSVPQHFFLTTNRHIFITHPKKYVGVLRFNYTQSKYMAMFKLYSKKANWVYGNYNSGHVLLTPPFWFVICKVAEGTLTFFSWYQLIF